MSESTKHIIRNEKKPGNNRNYPGELLEQDFFAQFRNEVTNQSFFGENADLEESAFSHINGDLPYEKQKKLRKKLVPNKTYIPNGYYLLTIDKWVLRKYWESYYAQHFYDNHGLHLHDQPLDWVTFKEKYAVQFNLFKYELRVPYEGAKNREKKPAKKEESSIVIDQEMSAPASKEVIVEEDAIENVAPPTEPVATEVNQASTVLAEPTEESLKETVVEPVEELSIVEMRTLFSVGNKNISKARLDKWIKKALDQGWKKGDPVPDIRSIQLRHVKELDGKPVDLLYVTANTYGDAYRFTKKHNYNGYWYLVDPITGQKTGMIQKHGSVERYNNDHYTYSETLIDDLYQISGDDSLRNAALKQAYLGDAFSLLVKDVQKKLLAPGYKFLGMYTPETKAKVDEKLAQIKLKKEQEETKRKYLLGMEAMKQAAFINYYISVVDQEKALSIIKEKKDNPEFLRLLMDNYRKIYNKNLLKDFTGLNLFTAEQAKEADIILLKVATIKEKIEVYVELPNPWLYGFMTQELEDPIVDLLKKEELTPKDLEWLQNNQTYVTVNLKNWLDDDDYFKVRKSIGPLKGEIQKDIIRERIKDLNEWYDDDEEGILNAMLELPPADRLALFDEMDKHSELNFLKGDFKGYNNLKAISKTDDGKQLNDESAFRIRLKIAFEGSAWLNFTDEDGITKVAELIQEKKLTLAAYKQELLSEFDNGKRADLSQKIKNLENELSGIAQISTDKKILNLLDEEIQPSEVADFLQLTGDNPKEEAKYRILGSYSFFYGFDFNTIFESYEAMLDKLNPEEFKMWINDKKLIDFLDNVADQLTRDEKTENVTMDDNDKSVLTEIGKKRKQEILNGFKSGDRVILAQCKIISAFGNFNDKEHIMFKALLNLTDEQDEKHFKSKDRTRFKRHSFYNILKNRLNEDERIIADNILAGKGLPESTVNYAVKGGGTSEEVLELYFKNLSPEEKDKLRLGFYLTKAEKQPKSPAEITAKQDYENLYVKLRGDETFGIPELEFEEFQKIIDKALSVPSIEDYFLPEGRERIAQILYFRVTEKAAERNGYFNGNIVTDKGHIEDKYYAEFERLYLLVKPDGFTQDEIAMLMAAAEKYNISHEDFLADVDRITNIAATIVSIVVAIIATILTEGAASPWLAALIVSASSAGAGIATKSLGGQLTISQVGEDFFVELITLGVGAKLKVIKGLGQGLTVSQVLRSGADELIEQSVNQSQKSLIRKMTEEVIDQQLEGLATEAALTVKDIMLLEQATYDILKQHGEALLSLENLAVNSIPVGSFLELVQDGSTKKSGKEISPDTEVSQKTNIKQEPTLERSKPDEADNSDQKNRKASDDNSHQEPDVSALVVGKEVDINKAPVSDQNINAGNLKHKLSRAAEQFTNLTGEIKTTYNQLFSLGLKHQIDGNTITFFGTKGEVIATFTDNKLMPSKWTEFNISQEKDGIKAIVVATLDSGHILMQVNGEFAFNLGFKEDRVISPLLREYKVIAPIKVRDGVTGPIQKTGGNSANDVLGGDQHQYELIDNIRGENWKKYLSAPKVHQIEGGKVFSDRTYELMEKFNAPPPGSDHIYAFVDGQLQIRRKKDNKAKQKYLKKLDSKSPDGYDYQIVDEPPMKNLILTEEDFHKLTNFSDDALKEAAVKVQESEKAQYLIEHYYFKGADLEFILENAHRFGTISADKMLDKLTFLMEHVPSYRLNPLVSQLGLHQLNGAKFQGAEFTVRWLAEQDTVFLQGITGFEVREDGRIYDLVYKDVIHYEFKNDKNPLGSQLLEQMKKDFQSANSLEDFQMFKKYVLSEEKAGADIWENVLDKFLKDPENSKILNKFIRKNKHKWDDMVMDSQKEGNAKYFDLIKEHLEKVIIVF